MTVPDIDPPADTDDPNAIDSPVDDDAAAADVPVTHNAEAHRYELTVEGETAVLEYRRDAEQIAMMHTEVPTRLRGRGLGQRLVQVALDSARADGLRIVAVCPFVRDYLRRHPPA